MNAFVLPRFYPIVDTSYLSKTGFSPIQLTEELLGCGVEILQYRHKEAWRQEHFDEAKAMAGLCKQAGTLFIINDRADFASLLHAGLHVGQQDLPPVAARRVLNKAVLGFSTHNASQLRRASEEPADYLSLGPIFATQSKARPDPVVGLDGLKALKSLTTKPLVAIGGITLANAPDVLNGDAHSVAVISGLLPEQPDRRQLRRRIEDWLAVTSIQHS